MLPVSKIVHVLFCILVGRELAVTGVTFILWLPMANGVHMLLYGMFIAKFTITGLALIHLGSYNRIA